MLLKIDYVKVLWLSFVNPRKDRSSRSQMFFNIGVLKYFANFTRKQLCWGLFLIKLQAFRPLGLQYYQKEAPTQVFSCEIMQIFKYTFFFHRTPPVAASGLVKILLTTSLVKILQSCHFNIFGINHRCFRKMPNKNDNE